MKELLLTLLGMAILPVLSALAVWLSKKKTPEEYEQWALNSPWGAFVVEGLRILGFDIRKVGALADRLRQRQAGELPVGRLISTLSPGLQAVLQSPALRGQLEALAADLKASGVQVPPTSPDTSTPSA